MMHGQTKIKHLDVVLLSHYFPFSPSQIEVFAILRREFMSSVARTPRSWRADVVSQLFLTRDHFEICDP
jgi:hypothetical protein